MKISCGLSLNSDIYIEGKLNCHSSLSLSLSIRFSTQRSTNLHNGISIFNSFFLLFHSSESGFLNNECPYTKLFVRLIVYSYTFPKGLFCPLESKVRTYHDRRNSPVQPLENRTTPSIKGK